MPELASPALPPGSMAGREQPRLAIDDLQLRAWRADDAPALEAAYQDPQIQRWHVRSLDLTEAAALIQSWRSRWPSETGAEWAVERDGQLVGRASLRRLSLAEGAGSVAYWVVPAARGSQVATRALGAVTDWAFHTLGVRRIELQHSTRNLASCRVAIRAGYALEGTMREQGRHADGLHDMHLHARLARDTSGELQ